MRTSLTPSMHFVGGSCGNFLKKINFTKIESEKRNTYVYIAGEFCYVKNKGCYDIICLADLSTYYQTYFMLAKNNLDIKLCQNTSIENV